MKRDRDRLPVEGAQRAPLEIEGDRRAARHEGRGSGGIDRQGPGDCIRPHGRFNFDREPWAWAWAWACAILEARRGSPTATPTLTLTADRIRRTFSDRKSITMLTNCT